MFKIQLETKKKILLHLKSAGITFLADFIVFWLPIISMATVISDISWLLLKGSILLILTRAVLKEAAVGLGIKV